MGRRSSLLSLLLPLLLAGGCSPSRRVNQGAGEGEGEGEGGGGSPGPCDPGAIRCRGSSAEVCNEAGTRWDRGETCGLSGKVCQDGEGCVDPAEVVDPPAEGEGEPPTEGEGEPPTEGEGEEGEGEGGSGCERGDRECRGQELWFCLSGGEWVMEKDCEETDQTCEDGECIGCEPGERSCVGRNVVECDALGRRLAQVEVCMPGTQCVHGACVQMCGEAGDDKLSYQGCEYWAVDLDNADVQPSEGAISPASAQFAVVVSNVNAQATTVTVFKSDDGENEEEVLEREVEPGAVEVLNLPARSQVGSGKGFFAYRVAASQPVIAYQFNPLNNTDEAFSNDASLLIPSNAFGQEYIVVTGDALTGGSFLDPSDWGAYVTIVGAQSEPVTVTVEASVDIRPPEGRDVQVNGRRVTATLHRYEVLSVHSVPPGAGEAAPGAGNLSGTRVTADGPVGVFSGNVAAVMPVDPHVCCADHLEEQLWPVTAWGRTFLAARTLVRREADPEADFWRITGSQDGTELEYEPRTPQGAPLTIDAGDSAEFQAAGHFLVRASAPIMVAQFLTSSHWVTPDGPPMSMCWQEGAQGDAQCTEELGYLASCIRGLIGFQCAPISDPSMVLVPPMEQFRDEYVFLAPLDYQTDFVNLIAPEGTAVQLDGEAVGNRSWQTVGDLAGTSWRVATLEVADGRHTVESDAAIGVLVYGYDRDVSYGYPGGLNLENLNPGAP